MHGRMAVWRDINTPRGLVNAGGEIATFYDAPKCRDKFARGRGGGGKDEHKACRTGFVNPWAC